MDRNFERALSLVLSHEGGWSDHKDDPGGATMKGVTLANFRRYVKPSATKDDLRRITDEQVATIYKRHYWDAVRGSDLPGGIDYAVFDFAVNSGPDRAIKYLQAVVGAKQDGRIGPDTLAKTRSMMRATIINSLCDKRMAFLKRLKTWPTFGKGWTSRVSGVRSEALKMAVQPDTPPPVVKEVEKEVVPERVETKVKEKSDLWTKLTGGGGIAALGLGGIFGMDWQAIVAGGVVLLVIILVLLLLRSQIVAAVRQIKSEVSG
ncbi:glycoside hydrolase family 108 protein [Aquamicrobium sp. NLF2-7]|uniref:glycoside hydrolase family 108 protein n=1 Tax=Aquamicrobium sp. NLF2-7 TaxID=2918753 RepID=UPI001EFC1F8E|nr:glycoside hydrolase family 108 protein [Aquamicrobium sp. NLF2-7]MCG8272362.1 glycoside hydrolase family 108 protein [Aquamicrobium sp. NLF2-7]